MKIPEKPHLNSYEAALTDEQRVAFRALLLSGLITTPNGIGNKAYEIWTKNYDGRATLLRSQSDEASARLEPSPGSETGQKIQAGRTGSDWIAVDRTIFETCFMQKSRFKNRSDARQNLSGRADLGVRLGSMPVIPRFSELTE